MPFSDRRDEAGARRARNSPRRPRISKAPEERRQEIVETALELFAEKGYEDTTMQDISDRMNVSPGLCYRYFRSKSELFAAASEYYAAKAMEELRTPGGDGLPARERLALFLRQIFEYVSRHREFEANYRREEELRAGRLDRFARETAEVMQPILEQGVEEKVFHCSDVPRTARFLVFGLIHTFHDEVPAADTEAYILEFRTFMEDVFSRMLQIEPEE